MRDSLPVRGPRRYEAAIVNLDSMRGRGTHWVAYRKVASHVTYYDSFGDLKPPLELVQYLKSGPEAAKTINYTYERQQKFDTVWCGHLCLQFLST
jgi:hypothetical protein